MPSLRFTAALAAAVALTLAALAPASAHGPTRKKVTETVEINAPVEKVWSVIGNFQDMSWLFVVEKTEGTGGNTPETAKRILTLKGGATVEESLYKYNPEKFTYMYHITNVDVKVLPVTNYASTISVTQGADPNKSIVEWKAGFYRGYPNNDPPPELNDDAAVKAVTDLYKAGLEGLKKKIEGAS